jgi:hypothetical protein
MQYMGIYTLANDAVYDQLVALLNSIEANVSPDIPVCVIPYDTQLNRVQEELNARPNVSLFDNWDSIQRWEAFAHLTSVQCLGINYHVDPQALEQKVNEVLGMDYLTKKSLGDKARHWYHQNDNLFRRRLVDILNTI